MVKTRLTLPLTVAQVLATTPSIAGPPVTVSGWIRSTRAHRSTAFVQLTDGSSHRELQIVLQPEHRSSLPRLSVGTSIRVSGALVVPPSSTTTGTSSKESVELLSSSLEILGDCLPSEYPLAKTRLPLDYLRSLPHLRSRSRTFQSLWRVRSAAISGIHAFFAKHSFTQTQPPILTSNDCEGGGQAFTVGTGKGSADKEEAKDKKKFFPGTTHLTVSGQLHLELLAASMGRVYTLGPAFRAEPSNSTRHLAEFWMLEAEMAFLDNLPQLTNLIEACLQETTEHVMNTVPEDLAFCTARIDTGLEERLKWITDGQFARMTYTEAINALSNVKKSWDHPVKWGLSLQSEHEKYLAEEYCKKPVFITQYPASVKPFYMKPTPGNNDTVECTDLLVPKMGELVGGSLRTDCSATLQSQLKSHGLDPALYDWYVDLRRFGSVPHGGFGLGLERYLALVTGVWNLRDWALVPRYQGHCPL